MNSEFKVSLSTFQKIPILNVLENFFKTYNKIKHLENLKLDYKI